MLPSVSVAAPQAAHRQPTQGGRRNASIEDNEEYGAMRIEPFFSICNTGWLILAIGLTIGSFSPLQAAPANSFPYTGVLLEESPIQSGPQADFYPTDRLPQGEQVEVYRVDNKDWLAIRPPRDSFSWVRAEHLELTESGTRARVINTPAKTRVGSRLGDIHDIEYISLNKGEVLELLGTKILRDPDSGAEHRWFKVAPPSGEFRWIHKDLVARVEKAAKPGSVAKRIKTFALPGESKPKALTLNLAQPVDSTATASSEVKPATATKSAQPTTSPEAKAIESFQREVEQAVSEQLEEYEELQSVKNQSVKPKQTNRIATQQIKTQQLPAKPAVQTIATQAIPTAEPEESSDSQWSRKEAKSSNIVQASDVAEGSTSASSPSDLVVDKKHDSDGTHHGFRIVASDQPKSESAPTATVKPKHPSPAPNLPSAKSGNPIATTHINAVTWEAVSDPKNPLAAPEPRTFEASYEALNILLSRSVLGDIEQWRLERVQEQAVLLKRAAQNRDQLALADELSTKIRKFQDLQRRKLAMQAEMLAQAVARSKAESEVDAALAQAEQAIVKSETANSKKRKQTKIALASYSAEDLAKKPSERSNAPSRLSNRVMRSKFQAVPNRKARAARKGPTLPRRVSSKTSSVFPPSSLQPAAALDNSIFDATGTLILVHARRNGLPRYALTDSRGQITRFVSSGDGRSLDHLVNSKVGLLGEIGLLAELNKSHIIAVKAVKLGH